MAATGYNVQTTADTISFRDQTTGVASISYDHATETLSISHDGTGALSFGDTSSDVFIGDGVNSIDLIFEVDGAIKGDTDVTLTLGSTDSDILIASPTFINDSLTVSGDLTVNGTTTTIDTANLLVEDKNIELGTVSTPTDTTADGGGITLKGATDKTINWVNSTDSWTSNQRFSAPNLTLTSLSNQSSEATALMINGSNVVGYRELGSAAFSATSAFLGATAKAADSNKLDNLDSTQFLRSDASDTFSGKLTGTATNENLGVGGIRGTTKGSQTGDYIHLYERVHIGGPSGWGHSTHGAPSNGLGVWGAIDLGMDGSGELQVDGTTVLTNARVLQNVTANAGVITAGTFADARIASASNWNTAYTHTSATNNPHSVTATQVGLGNVTNESKATMFASPSFTGTVTVSGILKDGEYHNAGSDNWKTKKYVRSVGVTGADIQDKWVHLSTVVINVAYEKARIKFNINSYDDVASGVEAIDVSYENGASSQEHHKLDWYSTDSNAVLFSEVRSIRSSSSGLSNTYDLYVKMGGDWRDTFTVVAESWVTHGSSGTPITFPTSAGSSTAPTAGSDDKAATSRQWYTDNSEIYAGNNKLWHGGNDGSGSGLDADLLDGIQGTSFLRSDANDTSSGTIAFGVGTLDPDSYSSYSGGFGNINDGGGWVARGLFIHGGGTGDAAAIGHNGVNLYFAIQDGSTANSMDTYLTVTPARILKFYGTGLTYNDNNIWHAGNDGASSGLDADLLDGVDGVVLAQSLRAGLNVTGGGTITVNSSFYIKNSSRFIVISAGRGSNFATAGYWDINIPTSGTITGVGGASNKTATSNGIKLESWEALYYILPIGSGNGSLPANFRVAHYSSDVNIPYNWILLAVRNGDGDNQVSILGGKYILGAGQSINTQTYNSRRIEFADKLTTARTIAGTSFNGSANIDINYNNLTNKPTIPSAANDATITLQGGGGITTTIGNFTTNQSSAETLTISHSDTSTQASVNNSNGTVIQDITLDTYGHITAIGSANLDSRYFTETESDARFWRTTQTLNLLSVTDGSSSNPFDNAHSETKIAASGTYVLSYSGASAHMISSYAGGSASVFQLGAHYNGDDFYMRVRTDSSNWKNWRKVFHDNYHPNADKLTTARNIALAGDVTGNANFDGSGNISITTSLAANAVGASEIAASAVGASELNVSGNGTTSQFLRSDGDGTFSWATPTDTNTTYSAGTHLSLSGTTFNVDFATADKVVNIGHNSTNNEGEIILNTSNAGSPQISFTDHGDASWAIGVDDGDNNFKIHGSASSTIPTIGGLATPLFEITTGGLGYLGTNRLFADNYHPNADTLTTSRTISLGGDLSGSAEFNGSSNITITAAVADDSHNHVISNVDGLQTALDGKAASSHDHTGLLKRSDIGSGADLNSYTTDGYYHQNANANASSGSNYPTVAAGMLTVQSDGVMVYQKYQVYSNHQLYHRTYYNGTWYAWQRAFNDAYHPNADTLTTARTISLGGDLSGSASFNGSSNITITAAVADDSHNHVISNVDGLQTALNGKLNTAGGTMTGNLEINTDRAVYNASYFATSTASTRHKFRLYYTDTNYAIGMQNGCTYGGLNNDWAMTFQFNSDNDRGFWWGDSSHTTAQGAMALTTQGKLTVARTVRVGYGETDTTTPSDSYADYNIPIKHRVYTASTLPSASPAGQRAFISDSFYGLSAAIGSIASGGGSNTIPVYSDGSNWRAG